MCQKRCFSSDHEARIGHRNAGYRIRTYVCPDCRAWHATAHEKRHHAERLTDANEDDFLAAHTRDRRLGHAALALDRQHHLGHVSR